MIIFIYISSSFKDKKLPIIKKDVELEEKLSNLKFQQNKILIIDIFIYQGKKNSRICKIKFNIIQNLIHADNFE